MKNSLLQRNKLLFSLFFILLLGSEFFYIDAFGGTLRLYHIVMPVVIISMLGYISRLGRSNVFWVLFSFSAGNVISCIISSSPGEALVSLGLLLANLGLSVAVALILISKKLKLKALVNVALRITMLGIFLGLIQVVVYRLVGVDLSLSESQHLQLAGGFSSGLRTEANSFAKHLNVIFLLVLPTLVGSTKLGKSLLLISILVAGMLASLTRSAIYGLLITLLVGYCWYQFSGRARLFSPRVILIIGVSLLGLVFFSTFVGSFNEYASHKLASFFDSEEILAGESSGFRLMSQGLLLEAFLASSKTVALGNGWGQIKFMLGDQMMQAGGGEFITTLAYGGLLAGVIYLSVHWFAVRAALRMVAMSSDAAERRLFEGVVLALLSLPITGQISGSLSAPEYWMMIGIAIYCGYLSRMSGSVTEGASPATGGRHP